MVSERLKFFFRAIVFVGLTLVVETYGLDPVFGFLSRRLGLPPGLTAANIAAAEFENFLVALICTGAFALTEKRRIDSYGLPVQRALGRDTWGGVGTGVVMAALVGLGMWAFGGMQIHGLATTGQALLVSALAWLGACLLVGVAEEFSFRSYFLQ